MCNFKMENSSFVCYSNESIIEEELKDSEIIIWKFDNEIQILVCGVLKE